MQSLIEFFKFADISPSVCSTLDNDRTLDHDRSQWLAMETKIKFVVISDFG